MEVQGMIKVPALGLALGVVGILASIGVANAGQPIRVQTDAAVTIDLDGEAKTVLVANPAIADVTPVTGRKLIVLGRGAGQTGLLIFDGEGKPLLDATVLVTPARQWAVTVTRGVTEQTLNCAPRCSPETSAAPAAAPATTGSPP
jgi:Flp pilus assembly secretin CpaC